MARLHGHFGPGWARRAPRRSAIQELRTGPRSAGIVLFEDPALAPEEAPDELELVQQAASGDRRAAEALLRSALPRVRNLVRYLVRGDGDVDDIAQEAMVAILRGLPSFRGDGSFRSWSDRIVARATFAYLKRVRAREQRHVPYAPELVAVGDADAHRRMLARRRAVRLLDQLPEEQRSVLVLHHVLGLGVSEIAEELATPFETVRSRLRLAKSRLRKLQDEGDTP